MGTFGSTFWLTPGTGAAGARPCGTHRRAGSPNGRGKEEETIQALSAPVNETGVSGETGAPGQTEKNPRRQCHDFVHWPEPDGSEAERIATVPPGPSPSFAGTKSFLDRRCPPVHASIRWL